MHQALSSENLSHFAHSTFDTIKRFIASSGGNGDLHSLTKCIEERYIRSSGAPDGDTLRSWVEVLTEELSVASGRGSSTQTTPHSPITPVDCMTEPVAAKSVRISRRKANEGTILYALDVLCIAVGNTLGPLVLPLLKEFGLVASAVATLSSVSLSKNFKDRITVVLVNICGASPSALCDGCEALEEGLSVPPAYTLRHLISTMRHVLLLHYALRRIDLSANTTDGGMRCAIAQGGVMNTLILLAIGMKQEVEAQSELQDPCLLCGTMAITALGGLVRGQVRNKLDVLKYEELMPLWVFYATNVGMVECSFSCAGSKEAGAKDSLDCDPAAVWAGELAEEIVEFCTTASFALQRQALYAEVGPSSLLSSGSTHDRFVDSRSTYGSLPKWEVLHFNWDAAIFSGTLSAWKLASLSSICALIEPQKIISSLAQLDLSSPLTEGIFRTVVAILVVLCRACPANITILVRADCFRQLAALMVGRSTTHKAFPTEEGCRVALTLRTQAWDICMALLAILLQNATTIELSMLLDVCREMTVVESSAEASEIVELCFYALRKYRSIPKAMSLTSRHSKIVCPLDRHFGLWYGYTFLGWFHPLCVWSEGCEIFSLIDSHGCCLSLVIVANAGTQNLAVRVKNKDDMVISIINEPTLQDGWNHIVVQHNFSGYAIYINGRKSSSAVNVPFSRNQSTLHVGGGSNVQCASFFGHVASIQLLDGSIDVKDIERLLSAGPGSCTSVVEPPIQATEAISISAAECISGTWKREPTTVVDVDTFQPPDLSAALSSLQITEWATDVLRSLGESANGPTVMVLCATLIDSCIRVASEPKEIDANLFATFARSALRWAAVPPQLPLVFLQMATYLTPNNTRRLHPVKSSALLLHFVMDVAAMPHCPTTTRANILRDLCVLLTERENRLVFLEGPRYATLLQLCRNIQQDVVSDAVALMEKLVRDPAAMDLTLRFLYFEEENKTVTFVKCEVLRMLYDISHGDESARDVILSAGGLQTLQLLLLHQAEPIRVYAMRLFSLLLCTGKKRDTFIKNSGFDQLLVALLRNDARVATYNCLFKFALGYFQPSSEETEKPLRLKIENNSLRLTTSTTSQKLMNGHHPSLIPSLSCERRPISCDFAGSECGDIDVRLSIDESYEQTHRQKQLVYPHMIETVLALLPRTVVGPSLRDSAFSGDGASSEPSRSDDGASLTLASRVLSFLDRIVERGENALLLLPFPWQEWLWGSVSAIFSSNLPAVARPLEGVLRGIIRKVSMVELMKSRQPTLKRLRDMVDHPHLQQLVLEETLRYLSANHGLERLDEPHAINVIRNLDYLLAGVEDYVESLSLSLGLEIVEAIGVMAAHSKEWVRSRMKGTKLFETRKQVAFHLLITLTEISSKPQAAVMRLVEANHSDPNATLVVVRRLVEAVKARSMEEVEVLQQMLRHLYAADEMHRRTLMSAVQEQSEVVEALIHQRRVVEHAEVEAENFISWCIANEVKWEATVQKMWKSSKSAEGEWNAKMEKAERERATKLKSRRAEGEKRQAALNKAENDVERMMNESEARRLPYLDALREVENLRISRQDALFGSQ